MLTRREIEGELKRQLALDYNCTLEDLSGSENAVTLSEIVPGRREYQEGKYFFTMATLGDSAVIMADRQLHRFLEEFIRDKRGFWLFEHPNLCRLERELNRYRQTLRASHHMFLPDPEPLEPHPSFEVRWMEQGEIMGLYGNPDFPNAICENFKPERPDVLAVAAMDRGNIIGLAGCSADCPRMWQIGIDVLPPYRRQGIGAALVGLLKDEVFRRGAIPFYGTSLSNLGSWKIALKCGFYPAWVEIESGKKSTEA